MLTYRQAKPSSQLSGVVRYFSERRCAAAHKYVPPFALPARTDQFIEFYLGDPYEISQGQSTPHRAPLIALVAPHLSYNKRLHMVGEVNNFTIHFTPTGFHRLFGCELSDLVDQAIEADQILTHRVKNFRDRLLSVDRFEERVNLAQDFIAAYLDAARQADSLDHVASHLAYAGWNESIATLARTAGLSERQFNRQFIRRTGLSPKLYGRLSRFGKTIDLIRSSPTETFTACVYETGYFDQAHFNKDCQAFTGSPPTAFIRQWPDTKTS